MPAIGKRHSLRLFAVAAARIEEEMPAPTPMCDTAESMFCARASPVRIAAVIEKHAIWMSRMPVFVMHCEMQGSNRLSRS